MENREFYRIPMPNMPRFQSDVESLNRRAEKLGVDARISYLIEGQEMWEYAKNEFVEVAIVTISGEAPRLQGWSFRATVQHTPSGNIIQAFQDEDVPVQFRHAEPKCDHCQTNRYRKDTYLVQHEDGRWMQVGSSCLRDFLGHKSPERIASLAEAFLELLESADDYEEYSGSGYVTPPYLPLVKFLSWVNVMVREHGWVSRSKSDEYNPSSADLAISAMYSSHYDGERPSEDDETYAGKVVDWISKNVVDSDSHVLSDYEWNLSVIAANEFVSWREVGYAASMIPFFQRAQEQLRRDASPEGSWFGEIKKRYDLTLRVLMVKTIEGYYGNMYLTKMVDADGNNFTWFASKRVADEGDIVTGKATVKDHTTYKGQRETQITRGKFEVVGSAIIGDEDDHSFFALHEDLAPADFRDWWNDPISER